MKYKFGALRRAIILALSAVAHPVIVFAETASEKDLGTAVTQLPTIIVTADKIERPLEKVSASIAVINGVDLEHSGIVTIEQLEGRIPGLSFQPFGQSGMKAPVMRGLTASVHSYSTSVLMLVDDVPTLTAQGFENNFLDADRIEVLRGPQSTLYGRNAESGVIAIHSRPMNDSPSAMLSTELGSRNKRATRFSVNSPILADTLYGSVSGAWLKQDGFIRNTYIGNKADNREHKDLKLGLRWTPSVSTDAVVRYTRQDYDDGATLWGNANAPRAQVASGTPSWNQSIGQTASLNVSHELNSGLRLRSITAYNDYKDKVIQDTDFRPEPIFYIGRDNHLRTLSQEVRLEGRFNDVDWLVGLYGDKGNNDLRNFALRGAAFLDYRAGLKTQSLALFTNWNVPLSDTWSLSTGGRIERMSSQVSPESGVQKKQSWTYFSPKLALQYQINPLHQWYTSVGRGIRAGGYNIFVSALDYPSYAPEESWSYETGFKGLALGQRLRYSVAAYVMKIDNMQVQTQPILGVIYTASAAEATSKGAEFDLDYLLGGGWKLIAGLAWNDTTFDYFQDGIVNYVGKYNTFVPKITGHIGLRYIAPQGWYAQASVVGSSKLYLDADNQYKRNGYGLVNLVSGYRLDGWEIAAYANNVANKKYDAVGYNAGHYTIYSPPREVGMRLTWRM